MLIFLKVKIYRIFLLSSSKNVDIAIEKQTRFIRKWNQFKAFIIGHYICVCFFSSFLAHSKQIGSCLWLKFIFSMVICLLNSTFCTLNIVHHVNIKFTRVCHILNSVQFASIEFNPFVTFVIISVCTLDVFFDSCIYGVLRFALWLVRKCSLVGIAIGIRIE